MATFYIMFAFWAFFGAVFVTAAVIVLGEERRQYPRKNPSQRARINRSAPPLAPRHTTRHRSVGPQAPSA